MTTTFFLFPVHVIHRDMKRDNNKSGNIVKSTNGNQQFRVNNKESFHFPPLNQNDMRRLYLSTKIPMEEKRRVVKYY